MVSKGVFLKSAFSVFIMVFACTAMALEIDEPYFGTTTVTYTSKEWRVDKKWFNVDWVELEVTVSADRKLISAEVVNGSGNEDFAQQQIKGLKKFSQFLMNKKHNGEYVEGKFIYRVDFLLIDENNPHYKDVIIPQITRFSSQVKSTEEEKKKYLLFVNRTHGYKKGKEVFSVKEMPYQGAFKVFQIDLNTVGKFDWLFILTQAYSYEQMENKFSISNHEFRKAISEYESESDAHMFMALNERESITEYEHNQKAPFDQKTEYWFERPKQKPPVFDVESIFNGFQGELTLKGYRGNLTVQATVLPSGKLDEITLLRKSITKRLNDIVLEALNKIYVIPAYKNHQPVQDEVVFDLTFKKRGELIN